MNEAPAVVCGNCGNRSLAEHCDNPRCAWSVCTKCKTFGTRSRWTKPRTTQ